MRNSRLIWALSPFICLAAIFSAASNCSADTLEIVANFDDGNSDTAVDAYIGMPGDGWATEWLIPTPTNQDVTAMAVTSGDAGFDEIEPGSSGPYVSYTATGNTTSSGSSALTRNYADPINGVFLSQPHTVEFTVRIDEDVSNAWTTFYEYADRYYLYDMNIARNGSYSGCRWLVSAYGGEGSVANANAVGQWSFYNGAKDGSLTADGNVSTGITLETGGIYDFTIEVDPATQSYDATVTNGTDTFSATDLGWRTSGTASGGYLGFNMRTSTSDDVRAMSVDNIKITQDGWLPVGGMNQISSHFDGGNSDTVVDAFPGMAGDGWGSPWARMAPTEDPTITGETIVVSSGDAGYEEVAPGEGNYLSHTLNIDATTTGRVQSAAGRNYSDSRPGIDFTQEHTINFKIRIDEDVDGAGTTFTHNEDRYYLYDSSSITYGPSAACTWLISAFAAEGDYAGAEVVGEWSFFDGYQDGGAPLAENNVDTNIALTAGGVYEFTITVDPDTQTYDASVSDGTDTFSASDLGWRTDRTYVGGNLNFTAWGFGGGDSRAFSLDSLVVSQGEAPQLPGDANLDGSVDVSDLGILATHYGTGGGKTWAEADFTGDGVVDVSDLGILATNYGSTTAAAVPEPGTLALLTLLCLSVAALRRRVR